MMPLTTKSGFRRFRKVYRTVLLSAQSRHSLTHLRKVKFLRQGQEVWLEPEQQNLCSQRTFTRLFVAGFSDVYEQD